MSAPSHLLRLDPVHSFGQLGFQLVQGQIHQLGTDPEHRFIFSKPLAEFLALGSGTVGVVHEGDEQELAGELTVGINRANSTISGYSRWFYRIVIMHRKKPVVHRGWAKIRCGAGRLEVNHLNQNPRT